MTRKSVVAGSFYESDPEKLKQQIKECFLSKFGPGKLPEEQTKGRIKAVIVPHAGYYFSGGCAAHAYKKITESKSPDTFILIGPNHRSYGSGLSFVDWETPLGIVKTNKELVTELTEKTSLNVDKNCHEKEHSLEVQLPFLQFLGMKKEIVAISLGQDINLIQLGNELFEALKNKNVVYIISSDFTHYGFNYGYVPFTDNVKENLNKLDKKAIDLILNFDIEGFKEYLDKTKITICGAVPILVLLTIMNNYKEKTSELLKYYTSTDVLGDYRNSVSYASILMR